MLFIPVIGFFIIKSFADQEILNAPLYFEYKQGDYLNVQVFLENIPAEVTNVTVVYESGDKKQIIEKKLNSYWVIDKLDHKTMCLVVQLLTKTGLRSTKLIAEGVDTTTAVEVSRIYEYTRSNICSFQSTPCAILVDFKQEFKVTHETVTNNNVTETPFNITTFEIDEAVTIIRDREESKEQETASSEGLFSNPNVLLYAAASLTVVIILITVITVIICIKKCHRNTHSTESMELNTYTTSRPVLYAELDLLRGDYPLRQKDEPPYAQIIGVLKPPNEVKM